MSEFSRASAGENASQLPSALDAAARIARSKPAVFLDYDGTLTPIVSRPEEALLAEPAREAVRQLARLCPVAVISGRDLDDVRRMVEISEIVYAGSHGFDIAGRQGLRFSYEAGEKILPILDYAETELKNELTEVEGARVERKKFTIAVHYRLVRAEEEEKVNAAIDRVLTQHPQLRKNFGKKVFELQPALDWNKGKAVRWLIEALHLGERTPVYIGDDITDEDAFVEIREDGVGIVVRDESRETMARYALEGTDEVRRFLELLAAKLGSG